jgi:hypothetical protein
MTRIGLECKLYRNTGTYAVPVWNEIVNAKDVTVPMTKGEADTSRRGTAWKTRKGTLKDASIDFKLVQLDGDEDFTALLSSYVNNTPIELLALNGPIGTAGVQGLRATCEVFQFQDNQALESAVEYDVSCKPTPATTGTPAVPVVPTWFVVAGT